MDAEKVIAVCNYIEEHGDVCYSDVSRALGYDLVDVVDIVEALIDVGIVEEVL